MKNVFDLSSDAVSKVDPSGETTAESCDASARFSEGIAP